MRIKRPAVGGRGYLPLFLYLYAFLLFLSPFTGKVNLFIQSQQGALDTPTQLRSLSTHPCQGELSPLELTFMPAYQDIVIPNSNTPHPRYPPNLCVQKANPLVRKWMGGGTHTLSNINYIYHFLMRPPKSVYPSPHVSQI